MSTWFWPLLDAAPSMAGVLERTPSLGRSDDSAVDPASRPGTPAEKSPLMYPQYALPPTRAPAVGATTPHVSQHAALPNILDAATACTVPIRHVCCIGAGYVGGPTAAVIALHNPSVRVTVVDRDEKRIAAWKSRHLPIREPGLTDVVRLARDGSVEGTRPAPEGKTHEDVAVPARQPNLFFSTSGPATIAQADMILISVNTPTKLRGLGAGRATDMTAIEGAVREIAQYAKPGAILVEKSTVPCKTGLLIKDILEAHRPGVSFAVLSNPEFLSEGTAIRDLMKPDRVIIGCESTIYGHRAAAALANLYAAWVPRQRIAPINIWSSELCKLVANAMLAQRISSINSISAICERTGADVNEIARSVGMDARIGPQFLKAGLGFGGSCFRKDIASLTYLAESLGLPEVADYWQGVLTMNDYQRSRFARRVISTLNNSLRGKKIAILGYAFKKNTGDARESPALDVIKILLEEGPRTISIYDPLCTSADIEHELGVLSDGEPLLKPDGPVEILTDPYSACANSNAVLVLTDWDMFKNKALIPKTTPTKPAVTPESFGASPTDLLHLSSKLENMETPRCSPPTPPMTPKLSTWAYGLPYEPISEPECAEGCAECAADSHKSASEASTSNQDRLDWNRVSSSVKEPKWVFDGRAVLDCDVMESMGFRMEVLGRASGY